MTDESELSQEELDEARAEELPAREEMAFVPISGDPSEHTLPPVPLHGFDQPVEPAT